MTHSYLSPKRPHGDVRHEPVRVLAVGDLVAQNGFDRLIDAFASVSRWNPCTRLIIAGEGPERDALERQLDRLDVVPFVALPGDVGPASLIEWTQRAHVFALPVRAGGAARGHASCLPGAMAGGLCVVATRSSETERLLVDGVSGLLVDADDDAALLRALHLAAANADLRRALGEAAAAGLHGDLRRSA